ncbi:hypothetical protein LCGC14_3103420 [marine sediment metagenome]|uniref:Uncharacterized protein n=1 Tax=marine sediment metagenome TaxID=412755 RepID=A0A0F8WVZ5_9ZZZZ
MDKYLVATHAMQSGVDQMMYQDTHETLPKHLRVGVNSAMCDNAGLAKLLVKKRIITETEYIEAITQEMKLEVKRYESRLEKITHMKVTLI